MNMAPDTTTVGAAPALLKFSSTLIWQIIFGTLLFYFRHELRQLFRTLAKLKVGSFELALQPSTPEAKPVSTEAVQELSLIGGGGFLTSDGIREIVNKSGL